jgi:hypothetical protein
VIGFAWCAAVTLALIDAALARAGIAIGGAGYDEHEQSGKRDDRPVESLVDS